MQQNNANNVYNYYTKPRQKFLAVFPIQIGTIVLFIGLAVLLGVTKADAVWTVLCGVLSLFALVWTIVAWQKCKAEEYALCKAEYAYLWQEEFDEGEEFETLDAETGIRFTIKHDGIKIVYPLPKDHVQVFDELSENEEFLPWIRTRFALATWKLNGFARVALAVIDVETAELDEDGEASYEEPFIIPLSKPLIQALKTFGVEDKTGEHWGYLMYNPDHALKQIYNRGYIRVMRDKHTGKRIRLED